MPGPLTVRQTRGGTDPEFLIEAPGDAQVPVYAVAVAYSHEDANLFAAAPGLLATLKATLDRATMPGFLRDQIKAAIAKAEGGGD